MRRFLLSAGTIGAIAGASLIAPGAAGARVSATSGTEHFRITTVGTNPGAVFARGVFTAAGKSVQQGNSADLFVFQGGSLTVHHPGGIPTYILRPRTCEFRVVITGTYTLKDGDGVFRGLSGSGTYVAKVRGMAPRDPNGICDQNARPIAEVTQVSAEGPVALPT